MKVSPKVSMHIKSNDKLKEIFVNTKKDAQIKDPVTGHNMELDIWIPSKKISFEFQVLFLSSYSCMYISFTLYL